MDRLQRQSYLKSFNNEGKEYLSNENADKVFSISELFELENLIPNLENVADKLDLCANKDVATISIKSQQDKYQECQQVNSQLTGINENFSIFNTSNEFEAFNFSLDPHFNVQQQEYAHKNLPSSCHFGVLPYTSEAKAEGVNYLTRSSNFKPVCEQPQSVINESDYRELIAADCIQKLSGLYQNELQSFNSFSTISSDPATSDRKRRDSLENNNLPSSCLLGARLHASGANEEDIASYFITSNISDQVYQQLQSNISESNDTQSIVSDYMQNSFELNEQNQQQSFNYLIYKSRDEFSATSDDKNLNTHFNTDTTILDLCGNNNEENLMYSTNTQLLKNYSGNFTHEQKWENSKRVDNQSSTEVTSHVNGKKGNEFVNNDELPTSVNGSELLGMNTKTQRSSKKGRVICQVCGKSLYRLDYLTIHYRYHTGEMPYACNRCSKRFAQQCDLTKHLRIHTGEKPYKCPICEKAFAYSTNRNRHYKQNHNKKNNL